ncbi:hypothetical protein MNBD_ALPHA05-1229, partial [hydrothermal vent metagenome]
MKFVALLIALAAPSLQGNTPAYCAESGRSGVCVDGDDCRIDAPVIRMAPVFP